MRSFCPPHPQTLRIVPTAPPPPAVTCPAGSESGALGRQGCLLLLPSAPSTWKHPGFSNEELEDRDTGGLGVGGTLPVVRAGHGGTYPCPLASLQVLSDTALSSG